MLRARWKQILFGAIFQYVHAMSTQLAHRMHEPQVEPLGDIGFTYLPVGAPPAAAAVAAVLGARGRPGAHPLPALVFSSTGAGPGAGVGEREHLLVPLHPLCALELLALRHRPQAVLHSRHVRPPAHGAHR